MWCIIISLLIVGGVVAAFVLELLNGWFERACVNLAQRCFNGATRLRTWRNNHGLNR